MEGENMERQRKLRRWLPVAMLAPAMVLLAAPVYAQVSLDLVAAEDSYVVQNDPGSNFGTTQELHVRSCLLSTNTGLKSPASCQTGTTGNPASDPARATGDEVVLGSTNDACCAWFRTRNPPSNVADSEVYRDFSFNLPTASVTIAGIEVRVSGYRTGPSRLTGLTFKIRLSGDGGASWTGYRNTTELERTDAEYVVPASGGTTDLWGGVWTAESFSNANFQLEVMPEGPAETGEQWKLDSIRVKICYTQNQNERTFLKFDLSPIPGNATVVGTELRATIKMPPIASRDYQAHCVSDDTWTQTAVTWNNQPDILSLLDTRATGVATGQMVWTGAALRDQVAFERFDAGGNGILSLRIGDAEEDAPLGCLTSFCSSESAEAAPRPVLRVSYTLPGFFFAGWRPPLNLPGPEDGWESGSTKPVKFLVVDDAGNPAVSGVNALVQIGASAPVAAALDDAQTGQWIAEIKLVGSGVQAVTITGNVQNVTPLAILVKSNP